MHNPAIIMELASHGSLRTLIDGAALSSIARKLRALHDIAAGMAQLHACDPPIGHRDLKSANVLVNGNGDCLIADFGLSKTIGALVSGTATATGVMHSTFGTPQWSSPEYIKSAVDWTDSAQAQDSDVWSFGVVVWEILTGELPWQGMTVVQLVAKAMEGEKLPVPACPECPELSAIINKCWSAPGERPSFESLESSVAQLLVSTHTSAANPNIVSNGRGLRLAFASAPAAEARGRRLDDDLLSARDDDLLICAGICVGGTPGSTI